MSRILYSIILSLALVLLAGLHAFGPGTQSAVDSDLLLFIVVSCFGLIYIRAVILAERNRKTTQSLTLNLENANITLTQLDKLKSEFLSFASHQIKTPMTVVKGYTQLIVDGSYGPVSEQLKEIIEKIKTSSDRMIGLVDTFLDLRRIDEGRIQYRMEPLDLGGLVASIVDEMQQLADRKQLRLSMQPLSRSWTVSADSQHLRQVIQNLIDNAIKYTDRGTVTVHVDTGEHPGTVVVGVTDTGRGLSRELVPKLFEQFSRDPSMSKEIAGTGLGLYIARRIIEAHHGRTWATSPGIGKGSTFCIELPTQERLPPAGV